MWDEASQTRRSCGRDARGADPRKGTSRTRVLSQFDVHSASPALPTSNFSRHFPVPNSLMPPVREPGAWSLPSSIA